MLERMTGHLETVARGPIPAAVEPSECSHTMLRPRWEADDYLCESCLQPFTVEEAKQVCSEPPTTAPRANA